MIIRFIIVHKAFFKLLLLLPVLSNLLFYNVALFYVKKQKLLNWETFHIYILILLIIYLLSITACLVAVYLCEIKQSAVIAG